MKKKIIYSALAILIVATILFISPLIVAFGKSGKGVTVLGKDYGLLSKKQIEEKLTKDFILEGNLYLIQNERKITINTASFSAQINQDRTASNLLFRRLKKGVGQYIEAFYKNKDFSLEIDYDEAQLQSILDESANKINKPYVPSEIVLENNKLMVKKGNLGQEVNKDVLKELILEKLKKNQLESEIEIPTSESGKVPNEIQEKIAIERAERLLGKTVNFKDREAELKIESNTLLSWIDFFGGVEINKLGEYVKNVSPSLRKEPQNAIFTFESGRVTDFQPDRPGYYLDENKFKEIILEKFTLWEKSNEKEFSEELPLIKSEAMIKTAGVNNMGIKELLGKGSSTFNHSSDIRNINIQKGAAAVNRVLVAPDEEFSFIKSLGEVSTETGYKMAYIIRAGRTELDVGGGICQVSTTLFRAMLDAGLDITQRRPHAYRVSYYEEDSPPGFDATVFIPNPDLKFKNDTGHYVLIQSYYDGTNKKLTYEIYGTSDGRKAEISNYKKWGATAAPPDVWIDDPTLPKGKIIKLESRVPGLNTSFDWTVKRGTETIHQQTFTSKYVPWAAVYRRGTGE
ncbi:MAG: VanW family protein [Candidatus Shapirobacteria bacterium]